MLLRNRLFFSVILVVVVSGLLFSACNEKDVPFAVDEDEIVDYINEVPTAYELFRIEGLVNGKGYRVPWDNGTYYDTLLDNEREYEFTRLTPSDQTVLIEPYGQIRVADLTVYDIMSVQTTRLYPDDRVEVDTSNRILERRATFLKLGSDALDFLGWWLYKYECGYNLKPVVMTCSRFEGSLFRPDSVTEVAEIDTVVVGSKLTVRSIKTSLNPSRSFQTISGIGRDSVFTLPMIRQNNGDTAIAEFNVSQSDSLFRDIYLINSFADTGFVFSKSWVLPVQL